MKNIYKIKLRNMGMLLFMFLTMHIQAADWYASPTGTPGGNGTITNPFDLQTALTSTNIVAGDNLWLRGGTYNGRFTSTLAGTLGGANITVASFANEWAILDGNILPLTSVKAQVLEILGNNVIYRDFEVTFSNPFRNINDPNFVSCTGINHISGEDCQLINLQIHDNPGLGIGSWKTTSGTLIYGCLIYNNGNYEPGGRGHGPGLYVQNSHPTKNRVMRNNIVFNNFYKGFELWSATTNATSEYVKNMIVDDNTAFNNGSGYQPSGTSFGDANILAKSADLTGNNTLQNITIVNNTLYHNTDYSINGSLGETVSLEIGSHSEIFPARNIIVENNFISGRNNAVKLYDIESLTFRNNLFLGRYFVVKKTNDPIITPINWNVDRNIYYTRYSDRVFRFDIPAPPVDLDLPTWQSQYGIDVNSVRRSFILSGNLPANNPQNVLKITQNVFKPTQFKVVLFNPPIANQPVNPNIDVDFSSFGIPQNTPYEIIDIESYPAIAATGLTTGSGFITFNTNLSNAPFIAPIAADYVSQCAKTPSNFGVFLIDFGENCVPNLYITAAVTIGSDEKEAGLTITATNEISPGAAAIYHAGEEVLLTDHFVSEGGSAFHGYVQGCSNIFEARYSNSDDSAISSASNAIHQSVETYLKVYPNPTNGLLNISISNDKISHLLIHSIEGRQMLNKIIPGNLGIELQEIDISKFTNGLYILTVETNTLKTFTQKIIKN